MNKGPLRNIAATIKRESSRYALLTCAHTVLLGSVHAALAPQDRPGSMMHCADCAPDFAEAA